MGRVVLLLILIAGTAGVLASQIRAPLPPKFGEHHFIGEQASLKVPFYGCANRYDVGRVMQLVASNEFVAGIQTAIRAGCRHFNAGRVGVIKSSAERGSHVCVRQEGSPDCYWLSATLLE
jgi:hypothetical protein